MAIGLVTEVMDWAPASLTHREHKVLIILAENAQMESRQTWDSVESPVLLRRARLSRREMYATISALIAKGCLENRVYGGRNHRAKYAIARLASQAQCADFPHTENRVQCADLLHTEEPGSPGSVCGKTTPRLFTGDRRLSAGEENPAVTPEIARPPAEPAGRERVARATRSNPAPPQSGNPPDYDGSFNEADQAQHTPTEVQLRSPATGRNARETCAGCGHPIPEGKQPGARYCTARCKNAATKRRARRAAKAATPSGAFEIS